jgi:hypothetical protein
MTPGQLIPISSMTLPALVTAAGDAARMRFLEFFAANIRNPHTRRAYYRAAEEFLGWCASAGVPSIAAVQPVHDRQGHQSVTPATDRGQRSGGCNHSFRATGITAYLKNGGTLEKAAAMANPVPSSGQPSELQSGAKSPTTVVARARNG